MLDGIDVLFFALGIVLIGLLWTFADWYQDWLDFDKDRRRQRKLEIRAQHEVLAEREYRSILRLENNILQFSAAMNGMMEATRRANTAFQNFGKKLAGLN